MSCAIRINSRLQLTAVKSFLRNHGVAIVPAHRNYSKSPGPIAVLEQKFQTGELKADKHQETVMAALQKLYDTIQTYEPPVPAARNRLFGNWFSSKKTKSLIDDKIPPGLYIHGSVGGGKTTLMDLFYDCCKSVSLSSSSRVEYGLSRSFQLKLIWCCFVCGRRLTRRNAFISIRS